MVLKLALDMVVDFTMTSTCFPNLKVLELEQVVYKDDSSAQNLISSWPSLQDLDICRCKEDNLQTLNVTSRLLKSFKVQFREENFEHEHEQKLMIDAPALESLAIDDNVTDDYVVRDLSSLTEANINVSKWFPPGSFPPGYDPYNHQMSLFELLRGISNVKSLSLPYETMQVRTFSVFETLLSQVHMD